MSRGLLTIHPAMRTGAIVMAFLCSVTVSALVLAGDAPDTAAGTDQAFSPGLAWVFFDDAAVRRPRDTGFDPNVNQDTGTGINDYAKVWIGWIKAPVAGKVEFSAEANNGLRLWIGSSLVIDGWSGGTMEGSFTFQRDGSSLPVGVEFFHNSREGIARLYWQWKDHVRELIPPSAFSHTARDVVICRGLLAGKLVREDIFRMEDKSSIYQPGGANAAKQPIPLRSGPHLFIDDFLIAESEGVERIVNPPRRDPAIPNPVITGKEDGCFQPYMTVMRDQETGRFRIWYGHRVEDMNAGRSHIGYMESEDGVNWMRPPRVLKDPAPITFGVSVIDDGAGWPEPARRFKYAWWHDGGLRVAASPDGFDWTPMSPGIVLPHNHDINSISYDPIRKRYVATISVYETGPRWTGNRRVTMQSFSQDLLNWSTPHYVITPDDGIEDGETQFYAMEGFLYRGDLVIGMVKVLHDDYKADNPPDPPEQYGIGYTELAWSRDGENWTRDRTPFFDRHPKKGEWDHGHAWIDEQVAVGDEVYLYYGGYARGHKVNRFEERQIGLLKMKRDRYVARQAGEREGKLTTLPFIIEGNELFLNADCAGGEARVAVLDESGKPIEGFAAADCAPISRDAISAPVRWKKAFAELNGKTARLQFLLHNARLFAIEIK
ncbi:MAG TPA: PA14 domain-containing protein [Candidatus Brocadiia bacterium]|nr:PA14 domain-containing protein [Candidatus Brocadiia bacterium]